MKNLIIIGAGGWAKDVLDSIDYRNFKMIGWLDDIKPAGTEHLGYPVLGCDVETIENYSDYVYFIAIGHNGKRKAWWDKLKAHNLSLINVIDRTAVVSPHAVIGEGNFIGKFTIVSSGASVGDNSIVNTRALVEHGSEIGNHVNLSTCTTLNGDVIVGEGAFVGSGSTVNGQITIGAWALVGSGAVVIKDVAPHKTVVGVPAREIESDNRKYN